MQFLIDEARKAGLNMVTAALEHRLGDDGRIADELVHRVAARVGVSVDNLEGLTANTPGIVIEAMRQVEKTVPEVIQMYLASAQPDEAGAVAATDEPAWTRAWRPAGMYLIGFLWLWNAVLVDLLNAVLNRSLTQMPFDQLMQVSALYMGLYMGGHTVKDIAAKWVGGTR